jgi:C_GCAxxG_C_C family probable redox protein
MDADQVEKTAQALFDEGWLCAESVLLAVAQQAGIDSALIPQIATGFCSGVSRTKGMCGAVSGGIMALGIVLGRATPDLPPDRIYDRVRQFLSSFETRHGSLNCFELTGLDFLTAEGREQFKRAGLRDKCREFTGHAARRVAEIIY